MAESVDNTLRPLAASSSRNHGDVPDTVRNRYYLDGRGKEGVGFYVPGHAGTPAFRDHGEKLWTARKDPGAIHDMVAIARHRQWSTIRIEGTAEFRREAWLAGRAAGLDVSGYQPSKLDLQALARRSPTLPPLEPASPAPERQDNDVGARATLRLIAAVVRSRVNDPDKGAAILQRAGQRVNALREQGSPFVNLAAADIHRDHRRDRPR